MIETRSCRAKEICRSDKFDKKSVEDQEKDDIKHIKCAVVYLVRSQLQRLKGSQQDFETEVNNAKVKIDQPQHSDLKSGSGFEDDFGSEVFVREDKWVSYETSEIMGYPANIGTTSADNSAEAGGDHSEIYPSSTALDKLESEANPLQQHEVTSSAQRTSSNQCSFWALVSTMLICLLMLYTLFVLGKVAGSMIGCTYQGRRAIMHFKCWQPKKKLIF